MGKWFQVIVVCKKMVLSSMEGTKKLALFSFFTMG